jgi:hypothetical protein
MSRDDVMSTPIFDELLREMAQRPDSRTPTTPVTPPPTAPLPTPSPSPTPDPTPTQPRRRHHRAD